MLSQAGLRGRGPEEYHCQLQRRVRATVTVLHPLTTMPPGRNMPSILQSPQGRVSSHMSLSGVADVTTLVKGQGTILPDGECCP